MSEDRLLRVVIGEDDVLMREGIARLVAEAGCEVVAQAGDAEDLVRKVLAHKPDVAVVDVQMPPHHANDGLLAARTIRERQPGTGVLVLSQYYEESFAVDLLGERADGLGYLLKERVGDVEAFVDALRRVASGGSALDPEVVRRMVARRDSSGPIASLTPREREVLEEMASGKTNLGIAEALCVGEATVEKHVRNIFQKLGLDQSTTAHRRVLAVLTYLRSERPGRLTRATP
jgi:DNA-binding NarL/FixJ family response regulator